MVTPTFDLEEKPEYQAFIDMIPEALKVFSTCNLTKEYVACRFWPLRIGWSISEWEDGDEGIPMPNFSSSFGFTKEGTWCSSCVFFGYTALSKDASLAYINFCLSQRSKSKATNDGLTRFSALRA
jgi:hypothetical protein